jgi:class 3 adenylate cyclase/tetratricopeptide (TPR) repeat protein
LKNYLFLLLVFLIAFSTLHGQGLDDIERNTEDVDNVLERARQADGDSEKESMANQSLSMARSLRYNGGIVRASMMLGEIYARTGRTAEALQHYLEAEAKVESSGNRPALLAIRSALGDIFFQEKLYGTARRYYIEVLRLKPQDYATLEKAADASLFDMQFDSAEVIYKELIVKYREEGNSPRLVKIYQKLARAYDEHGDPDIIEKSGTIQEQSLLYNNLGRQYATLHDYPEALEYFRKSELQCTYIPCDYPEVLWANIGVALHNTGKTKEGIEYLLKARALLLSRKDWIALANLEHLLAGVYFSNNDLYNALAHNDLAIKYARENRQPRVLADAYRTAADLYHQLYDFEKAFENYKAYLNILDSVRVEDRAREQKLTQQRALLAEAEGQIKFLIARQNFKDLELSNIQSERELLRLANVNLELEARQKEDELRLLEAQKDADEAKLREKTLQYLKTTQELRLSAQKLDAEKQKSIISELRQKEEIERAQNYADSTRRSQELLRVQSEQEFQQQREANFRSFVKWLGGLASLILAMLFVGWFFARRASQRLKGQNLQIQAQNRLIEQERQKSDGLLLNILPEEIAQELKSVGQATPKHYESATVLFTDFVGFTKLSSRLSPEQLLDELNACFLAFDEICDRHGLEKIKTIGDAYMCAGGLPVPNDTHPIDAVKAAFEMIAWLKRHNSDNNTQKLLHMRIGIHTGPVVAGVVGKKKFAYDIWGDAVNMAARLEEHGESGKLNISSATAEAIKGRYQTQYRGKIDVHNKGLVDMYFILPS